MGVEGRRQVVDQREVRLAAAHRMTDRETMFWQYCNPVDTGLRTK